MRIFINKLGINSFKLNFLSSKHDFKIGEVYVSHSNNIGYINKISVNKKFQMAGNGSKILNDAEKFLHNLYNVNTFKLVAWQHTIGKSSLLCDFYFKNGYIRDSISLKESSYDDGSLQYDLIPLIKRN